MLRFLTGKNTVLRLCGAVHSALILKLLLPAVARRVALCHAVHRKPADPLRSIFHSRNTAATSLQCRQ